MLNYNKRADKLIVHFLEQTRRCRVVGRARTIGNRVRVKSSSRVRISPSPPCRRGLYTVHDNFLNSLLIHPVAPPFQLKPAAPGFDLVFGAILNAAASVPLRCCIKILCLFSWLQHNLLFSCFQPRPTRATARVARFFRLPPGSNVWTVGDAGPCAGAKNTLSS